MNPFDQQNAVCRCEWGGNGVDTLARADVVIVIDVLSFSTCVDIAAGRGAVILPYPWKDASARDFATEHRAELSEAESAIAAFETARQRLRQILFDSGSGRELVARGFAQDVELAAAFDVSEQAARFEGDAFRGFHPE